MDQYDHRNNDDVIDNVDRTEDVVLLPGFRFHPTDEELVGFYLKRKIQQRTLATELIVQLDIYKYDPWDLPKFARSGSGEKEWYFYCLRDRKYKNSTRPNRVTGAGFWKATGTDRPIYSTNQGNKCIIGLKKSLVFYRGRASKGIKTDWMMHEFRLPSLCDHLHSASPPAAAKKFGPDISIPANESLAICRIFKKTNTTAQRVLSNYSGFVTPILPEITHLEPNHIPHSTHDFNSRNIPLSTDTSFNYKVYNDHHKPMKDTYPLPISTCNFALPALNEVPLLNPTTSVVLNDSSSSMFLDMHSSSSTSDFCTSQEHFYSINRFSFVNPNLPQVTRSVSSDNTGDYQSNISLKNQTLSTLYMDGDDITWKPDLLWDCSNIPSDEMFANYSTN